MRLSLAGRFSALVLTAVGVVLVGFSTALYASARVYLHRQVGDRIGSALAVLAAAAEVHPEGVEWEPQERVLPLGQESGPDRLRWMVFDGRGRRVDHSRNLVDADLTPYWAPRAGDPGLPGRLVDRRGRTWRVSQLWLRPGIAPASGSQATQRQQAPGASDPAETVYPSLVLTVCAPLGPTEATLAALGWLLAALGVATWLASALLCRRLSRRALTPLTRMVTSARSLDATDPGWSLEEAGTGDELDDLGRAFNDLLSRLHVAYERQRRFSGDASHQLRTPLTVLIGQLEVGLRQERSGEEYRRALTSALGRAVQLSQIVEALLFLGRADAEARLPGCEPIELGRWVAEHLADRTESGRTPEVVYRPADGGPIWVRAHPPLLGQLLDNLLENAAKHGRSGAPIRVETSRAGGAAVLAVVDAGRGIPPGDLPRLFEPFYRSTQTRRLGVPGAGLGLAVVHRIATAFGGTVAATSELGLGSRFEVQLPEVPAPAVAPSALPVRAGTPDGSPAARG
jgi:signal transduction histidine kinase